MNSIFRIIVLTIIGCVGYGVWAFMAYDDPSLRANFLNFNISMALGTIGLVLRDMKTPGSQETDALMKSLADLIAKNASTDSQSISPSTPPAADQPASPTTDKAQS